MSGKRMREIASAIARMSINIVNVYFIGEPGQPWVLVDTGTPGSTRKILAAANARYGKNARPAAILLTHGHTDHGGCASALATIDFLELNTLTPSRHANLECRFP